MSKFINATSALSNDAMRKVAPSMFSATAAPGVSEQYQYVSTADIVEQVRGMGYLPVSAGQSKVRSADGNVYAKHVVRMMHEKYMGTSLKNRQVGDIVPELVLTNSHNRTSAFHMSAGLRRIACLNGMMASAGDFTSFRVLHNDKNIHDLIVEGVGLVRELTESVVLPQVERMVGLEFTPQQVTDFAEAATVLKFGEVRPAEAQLMLEVRRAEDAGRNMWSVLNRIQENAVKGGYQTMDAAGRNVTARGITSVARDYDFNMKLWNLGSKVLEVLA